MLFHTSKILINNTTSAKSVRLRSCPFGLPVRPTARPDVLINVWGWFSTVRPSGCRCCGNGMDFRKSRCIPIHQIKSGCGLLFILIYPVNDRDYDSILSKACNFVTGWRSIKGYSFVNGTFSGRILFCQQPNLGKITTAQGPPVTGFKKDQKKKDISEVTVATAWQKGAPAAVCNNSRSAKRFGIIAIPIAIFGASSSIWKCAKGSPAKEPLSNPRNHPIGHALIRDDKL